MRIDSKLLNLPTSILLLVASHSDIVYAGDNEKAAVRWPFDLLSNLKYWPGESANRDVEATNGDLGCQRKPVGVMKMSDDEGEKFYMEYWQFEANPQQQSPMLRMANAALRRRDDEEQAKLLANASIPISYRPAFALHTEHDFRNRNLRARGEAAAALAVLEKRDFACPTGTSNCSSIGYPNSCCATDETCFKVTDTGLGPVGCCPSNSNCGGTITKCDSPNLACPDNLGGGCCIPNYVCAEVGCVINSTATAVVTTTYTITASQSSSIQTVVTTTSPVVTASSTYTGLQTTLACSTNSHACPVGMGGGCCGNGYACASQSSCIPLSSQSTDSTTVVTTTSDTATVTGVVPLRPTGDTSTTTSSTDLVTTCPTGFYACEAYYAGGCCRTGRNCDTTSCPATSSTTIISSGATIVVPVGAAATTAEPTGNCASGWFTCSASVGGNCCPSGYDCGTASCSLVEATATVVSPKEAPNSGSKVEVRGTILALVGVVGALLVLI